MMVTTHFDTERIADITTTTSYDAPLKSTSPLPSVSKMSMTRCTSGFCCSSGSFMNSSTLSAPELSRSNFRKRLPRRRISSGSTAGQTTTKRGQAAHAIDVNATDRHRNLPYLHLWRQYKNEISKANKMCEVQHYSNSWRASYERLNTITRRDDAWSLIMFKRQNFASISQILACKWMQ